MSDTPRTDAQLAGIGPFVTDSGNLAVSWTDYECLADLALQLERELARVTEELEGLMGVIRELLDSSAAQMPPFEAVKEAQDAWADRRAQARNAAHFAIDAAIAGKP
jgi:hypothetical protein